MKITLQGSFIVSVAIVLSIFCEYAYIKLKKSKWFSVIKFYKEFIYQLKKI